MAELVPPFAAAVTWGALSVHGDAVGFEAEVSDPESADVLTALVTNAFPEPTFKRVIELRVAAPAGPSDGDIMALEELASGTVTVKFLREDRPQETVARDALGEWLNATWQE